MPEVERYAASEHAPPHLFRPGATYCLTARTLGQVAVMEQGSRREELVEALHFAAKKRNWSLIAWVALNDHYHCLVRAPEASAAGLSGLVNSVHSFLARKWNKEDEKPGRAVWYQFWDSCITFEASFYARLNYIHHNPVKHGLVTNPADYPYSSYGQWSQSPDVDLPALEIGFPWGRIDLEA